jgi:predicted metal-dependent phosphoesterase TrpH
VWPGVEITCEYNGAELHLLAYLFDTNDAPLLAALAQLRRGRRERILALAERLQAQNVSVMDAVVAWPPERALGRRHLARLLLERGYARSLHHAFHRFLGPASVGVPKTRLPVHEALALVRRAGGVTSWAHPPHDTTRAQLEELQAMGLHGVECVYPWPTSTIGKRLRALAEPLGLVVTGGSDSHDPGPRAVGAKTITAAELAKIMQCR